jgi:hypothetical protein
MAGHPVPDLGTAEGLRDLADWARDIAQAAMLAEDGRTGKCLMAARSVTQSAMALGTWAAATAKICHDGGEPGR